MEYSRLLHEHGKNITYRRYQASDNIFHARKQFFLSDLCIRLYEMSWPVYAAFKSIYYLVVYLFVPQKKDHKRHTQNN